jgi:hypothetical protein
MVAKLSLTERPARLATGLVTATVLEDGLVTNASEAASIMERLFISEPLKQIKKVQKYEFTYKQHLVFEIIHAPTKHRKCICQL